MKSFLFSTFFLLSTFLVNAQVGIGTITPSSSSMLDITSANSGLLIPRIALTSSTDAVTIPSPVTSLLIYNTGAGGLSPAGYYYWNGTTWITLAGSGGTDWTITGNSGTTAGTNFIGTSDAVDLRIKTGGTDKLNISNTNGQVQSYSSGSATAPSYSFTPDTNTGVYSSGADNLNITTGGTERVRVDNTGKVGINATPTSTLDIAAVNATGVTTNVDGILIPRVDRQRAQSMSGTPTGTLVYVNSILTGTAAGTTVNVTAIGFYFYDGTVWIPLVTGTLTNDWSILGNTNIVDGTNFMGTGAGVSGNVDVAFRRNNLPSGKIAATSTSFGLGALNSGVATNCTAFGVSALNANNNTTGTGNSAFGTNALRVNTSGTNNTAIGATASTLSPNAAALGANSTGANNTAVGAGALAVNTVTSGNTAIGSQALAANVSAFGGAAENNTAIGSSALLANTTGRLNVALGVNAGSNITTSSNNIMIGANTPAQFATSGAGNSQLNIGNTIFGNMAAVPLTLGVNTSRTIGINVLSPLGALDITSSDNGFLIPRISLTSGTADPLPLTTPTTSEIIYNTNTVGNVTPGFYYWDGLSWVRFNTGVITGWSTTGNAGLNSGTNFLGTTDGVDVAFRRSSSPAGRIAATSTSFGLNSLTAGAATNGTAFGINALAANTGSNNVAVGINALAANDTPGDNTAIGFNALAANTLNSGAGNLNTAVGSGALDSLNGGARNTAIGANALTGVNGNASLDNVAVGHNALPGGGTIDQSVAIGAGALLNSGSGTTRSTVIGYNAGNAMTQSIENVIIGWSAQGTGATARNQIAIGAGATASGDNDIRLGNTAIDYAGIQVAWTVTSDRRWKDNIKDSSLGLNFLKTLRPVSYIRNNDVNKKTEYGFIAQELEDAFNKAGDTNNAVISKDDKGMYGVRYNDFISITVKAVQEQQEEIEALKQQNAELMKTNEAILKRLEALEKK